MKRIEMLANQFVNEEIRIQSKPIPNIKSRKYGKDKKRATKQFQADMENAMLEREFLNCQYENGKSEFGTMFVELVDYKRKQAIKNINEKEVM